MDGFIVMVRRAAPGSFRADHARHLFQRVYDLVSPGSHRLERAGIALAFIQSGGDDGVLAEIFGRGLADGLTVAKCLVEEADPHTCEGERAA
jgi:predicted alpha-1,6-mannanase (GH76 family)